MVLNSVRLIPHLILMMSADSNGILRADLVRWAENSHLDKPKRLSDFVFLFIAFMTFTPEFSKVWRRCDGGIAIIFGVQRHINRIDEIA